MNIMSIGIKNKPLRKCSICGLEAWTIEDLKNFREGKRYKHGYRNLCFKCEREWGRNYHKRNVLKQRYKNMIARCYNENDKSYHNYGGRGITVCDEWKKNRQSFVNWAKENRFKAELTIDRIDNDGPYAPWNCQWISRIQQHRNTRYNVTDWEKGTRICRICKIEKPLSEFHRDNRAKCFYHTYECKDCYKSYRKILKARRKIHH